MPFRDHYDSEIGEAWRPSPGMCKTQAAAGLPGFVDCQFSPLYVCYMYEREDQA